MKTGSSFTYIRLSQLVRHLLDKGAFRDAHDNLHWVYTDQNFYWFRGRDYITNDEFDKVMKLLKRYKRFYNYVTEISPQWTHVEYIHWADNSVDEIQINKFGETRQVMVTAPHGDIC